MDCWIIVFLLLRKWIIDFTIRRAINTKFTKTKSFGNACLVRLWREKHIGRRHLPRDFTIMLLPVLLGVVEKPRKTSNYDKEVIHGTQVYKQVSLVNDVVQ